MKNLLATIIFSMVLLLSTSLSAQTEISKAERKKASASLKSSQSMLLKSVKGLSDAQLNFKSSPESWSVAECVEHIAISESALFGLVGMSLQADADPSLRSSLPFTDDQIMGFITDRSTKVKTQEPFEPKNNFGSYEGTLAEFKKQRKSNMKYVKKTDDDLRNHYFDLPFGKLDAYQLILFMSGHVERHTKQIQEVMAGADFPAS